jgi:hypothetical protein
MQNAARAEVFPELRVLWIVGILGLFLRIEMVEVAKNSSKPCTVGRN